jgi:hypothetical protein
MNYKTGNSRGEIPQRGRRNETIQKKRFSYIFLNAKDRILKEPANTNDNICRWRNLQPLPSGSGNLTIVSMTYRSSVPRNHTFVLTINGLKYNYNSTDNFLSEIGRLGFTRSVRIMTFSNAYNKPIEIPTHTNELRNIDLRIEFVPEFPSPTIPGDFRPILDSPNFVSFVLKFEYD